MTEKIEAMRRPGPHPELTLIAAHADRRLAGEERARVEEHLARCSQCFEIYAETIVFKEETASSADWRRGFPGAFAALSTLVARPAFRIAAGIAAVLLLALPLWLSRSGFLVLPSSPVAELVEAVGERRLVEPRLTGGFRYSRLLVMRSVEAPHGLDAQPAAVIAAVARIRERAEKDPSPEALGALGVTYLVSGDVGAAVKALESATNQKTDDPQLWSDLAAAYLERARQADEPADIPKALEAAERAIALPDPPDEAYFNRALALEALHLDDAANKAWEDYLVRDASSGWADEARQHIEKLVPPRQSSVEEERARVRAALEEGQAAVDRVADESPQLLRDYLDDVLLPAWADAQLVGQPDARTHGEHLRLLGEALAHATTDVMARDTAHALTATASSTSRDPLRSQAQGLKAYFEAKRSYEARRFPCREFGDAAGALESGGSPYAGWARLFSIYSCWFSKREEGVLAGLGGLGTDAERRGYVQLLGRVRWLEGLTDGYQARLTASMDRYRLAGACFRTTHDAEGEAMILGLLAEAELILGESRGAWRHRLAGLDLLQSVRSSGRRSGILAAAALASVQEGLPRTARHFASALFEVAAQASNPVLVSQSLLRRADIHHAIGADTPALADLREAREWIERIIDKESAEGASAEADATEGGLLLASRPEAAAQPLGRALKYFELTSPVRVPPLRLLSARALRARGLDDAAEGELLAGIEALEAQRPDQRESSLQVSFFDQALPLFNDMVRAQVTRHHDPERGLAFVERARARQLGESLAGTAFAPLEPRALRESLPEGLSLVYYLSLPDRLFEWVLTRQGIHFVERPLPLAELAQLLASYRSALETRASIEAVRRPAARLHEELVRPLLPFLGTGGTLVFVPDQVLQSVAFSSLWDPEAGRYLIEDRQLAVVPSGSVFLEASARMVALARTPRALVVGNPRVDRGLGAGFPSLPGAEAEAAEIASLYTSATVLTGKAATKAAFLSGIADSEVVHYAGHATASDERPSRPRLLLARNPVDDDSGLLRLGDLDHRAFSKTRVVVLAACRTGAGAVSGVEGALSLARPFLAAGVPAVVASRWDIDDAVSRRLLVAFHRSLLEGRDPAAALRSAQTSLIRSSDPSMHHPASWAAFVYIGGFNVHSLPKGVIS